MFLTAQTHLVHPKLIQVQKKLKVYVDEALPEINLPQPRLRLHRKRNSRTVPQQIILINPHDQYQIRAMHNPIPKLILQHIQPLPRGVMRTELTTRHVLRHKLPLPRPAATVEEACVSAVEDAHHEGVVVRCRPETQEGEASVRVLLGECACGGDYLRPFGGVDEGWGVGYGEVAVLVLVVDEEVEFVWAVGFCVGGRHAENDFGMVLHVCWGYDTSLVHCNLLARSRSCRG